MKLRIGEQTQNALQEAALEGLARGVEAALGFTMIVVNIYRPSQDLYEAIVVRGPEELRDTLHGEALSRECWMALLDSKFEHYGAFFVPEGEGDWGEAPVYEPPEDAGEGENRWRKGDALFAPIRSAQGPILGILCVDMPKDGQRPDDRQMLKLTALCAKAAAALEQA